MLKIIKDTPAFSSSSQENHLDAFNHQIFADILIDLIKDNDPSLTIGLFGGWGVGKTSIINQFISKAKNNFISPIYFNAWKYSGDSFRRQLLLTLVDSGFIIKNERNRKDKFLELQKLNYSDIEKEENEKIAFSKKGLINLVMFGVFSVVGIGFVISGGYDQSFAKIGTGIFALVVSLMAIVFGQLQQIIKVKIDRVVDPKLIFPEQFTDKFKELICIGKKDYPNNRITIIVDDLDRCDVETIKNVLVTLKTFLESSDCYFIIPLDDASVIKMFETKQNLNFGYEQLRKYFNVFVRIPEINNNDIVAFAEQIAKDFNIDNDVALIATLGNCSDARKMKHFLNLFKVKEEIANQRIKAGLMGSLKIDDIRLSLAKIAVLEYQFPELFSIITLHPEILEQLTYSALVDATNSDLNLRVINPNYENVEDVWNQFQGLKDFLRKTNEINIGDVELISRLKVSNYEGQLSDLITSIRNYILYSGSIEIDSLLKDERIISNQKAIAKIIDQYSGMDSNLIKDKTASFALKILVSDIIDEPEKTQLTLTTAKLLVRKECKVKINYYDTIILLNKMEQYQKELKKSISNKIIIDIFQTTDICYQFSSLISHSLFSEIIKQDADYDNSISTQLLAWYNSIKDISNKILFCEQIVNVLEKDIKLNFSFPSKILVDAFINEIPESMDDAKFELIEVINTILLHPKVEDLIKNSDELLLNKISKIISTNISDVKFNKIFQNGCDLIIQAPFWLKPQFAIDISTLLSNNFNNFPDAFAKEKLLLVLVICNYSLNSEDSQKSVILKNYNLFVDSLPPQNFEKHITDLLHEFGDSEEERLTVIKNNIKRRWDFLNQIYNSDHNQGYLIFDVCFTFRKYLEDNSIEEFIKSILSLPEMIVIQNWQNKIYEIFQSLNTDTKNDLLELIIKRFDDRNNAEPIRDISFSMFINLIKYVAIDDFKHNYTDMINSLVDESDLVKLKIVSQNYDTLIAIFSDEIPKSRINSLFNSITSKKDYKPFMLSLNICLRYENELTTYDWQTIGERVISELFDDNLSVEHRIILLSVAVHINNLKEHRKKLSKILFEYKESGTDETLKAKAWEVYEALTSKKIIPYHKED